MSQAQEAYDIMQTHPFYSNQLTLLPQMRRARTPTLEGGKKISDYLKLRGKTPITIHPSSTARISRKSSTTPCPSQRKTTPAPAPSPYPNQTIQKDRMNIQFPQPGTPIVQPTRDYTRFHNSFKNKIMPENFEWKQECLRTRGVTTHPDSFMDPRVVQQPN